MGWRDDRCACVQASLDRDSNKKTGPSDEDIIESFKKCGPHPHALHLNVPLPPFNDTEIVISWRSFEEAQRS